MKMTIATAILALYSNQVMAQSIFPNENLVQALTSQIEGRLKGALADNKRLQSEAGDFVELDFSGPDASKGPANASAYLAARGIQIERVTHGMVCFVDGHCEYEGKALTDDAAGSNYLTQKNTPSAPIGYQLKFSRPVCSLTLLRAGYQYGSSQAHWTAYAMDAADAALDKTGEPELSLRLQSLDPAQRAKYKDYASDAGVRNALIERIHSEYRRRLAATEFSLSARPKGFDHLTVLSNGDGFAGESSPLFRRMRIAYCPRNDPR